MPGEDWQPLCHRPQGLTCFRFGALGPAHTHGVCGSEVSESSEGTGYGLGVQGWAGQSFPRLRQARRVLKHHGPHRSPGSVRAWGGGGSDGWPERLEHGQIFSFPPLPLHRSDDTVQRACWLQEEGRKLSSVTSVPHSGMTVGSRDQ